METSIKPFLEVVSEVNERLRHGTEQVVGAEFREPTSVFNFNSITSSEDLKEFTNTVNRDAQHILHIANREKIDLHYKQKNIFSGKGRVGGWIIGTEVLEDRSASLKNGSKKLIGTFLTSDVFHIAKDDIFFTLSRTISEKERSNKGYGFNSELYGDKQLIDLFRMTDLKQIDLNQLALIERSQKLVTIRENLAQFAIKHGLIDKL